MYLPETLQNKLTKLAETYPPSLLKKGFEELAKNYRNHKTYNTELERIAYLFIRMPATYAALFSVLKHIPPQKTFVDAGAGPGTSLWVLEELFPECAELYLFEKDREMIDLGKNLSTGKGEWIQQDLEKIEDFPPHDVALFSYSYGEFSSTAILEHVWKKTRWGCVIVEPGTSYGFSKILEARSFFIERGASIFAPCPHKHACPNKWCHFPARVERSFYHKYAKTAKLPYEDEKYAYLIVTKNRV